MEFWKVNVEKFTFSSVEAWKSATSLLANSFKFEHSDQMFSYPLQFWELQENNFFTKKIFMSACEIGTNTRDKC